MEREAAVEVVAYSGSALFWCPAFHVSCARTEGRSYAVSLLTSIHSLIVSASLHKRYTHHLRDRSRPWKKSRLFRLRPWLGIHPSQAEQPYPRIKYGTTVSHALATVHVNSLMICLGRFREAKIDADAVSHTLLSQYEDRAHTS